MNGVRVATVTAYVIQTSCVVLRMTAGALA